MRVGAVILAAGGSRRMGGTDKLLANLAGRPVLSWTLAAFEQCDAIDDVVVATSAMNRRSVAELCIGLGKIRALVQGGDERQNSVRAGLSALQSIDVVVVHDGARPLITAAAIAGCVAKASSDVSVIAGSQAVDTIKVVGDAEEVLQTPARASLRTVVTPQVFLADTLRRAHAAAARDGVLATDDAGLVERLGERVLVHDLGAPNPKITAPPDLVVAEALLGARHEIRCGIGIDSHRFASGRKLVLGGVEIADEDGLAGHSDADVLTHAIIDALLGAVGLGDIGAHFGTSNPKWKDANSGAMLRRVMSKLADLGARPQSVAATVIAERPRLRPHVEAMRQQLSEMLRLDRSAVNVAATTAEGMGALGRAEGIAAHAVATVRVRTTRAVRESDLSDHPDV